MSGETGGDGPAELSAVDDPAEMDGDPTELSAVDDPAEMDGDGLEVAVVGAGAVGATAAYDLARRGAAVTLYDREGVASGASGRAAGVCYAAFAGRPDAELAGESIERFRRLSGEETFPFVECPYVWLAREGDDRRAAAIREDVERMQAEGVVAVEVDGPALGDRFPALRTDDVAVAGIAGAAGHTDPARYTACLAAAATGAGASLETGAAVAVRTDPPRIVVDGGERTVDAVLVAAGAHTGRLLAEADAPIAVKPYRTQALTASATLPKPICYDATGGFYVRPHPAGLLAGDGTEEVAADPDGYERGADPEFPATLLDRVTTRCPDADPELQEAWAGLCTATPDGDPLVGRRREGVYVATGFQGHGLMRAPAIGERIAEEILGGPGIEAFDPRRFSGEESFEIREGMAL